ncbi:MAG: DUF6077 domain-containing protein [Lachnospiraceae bacterium]|nr:DUF6077 domain-containing protein [Lachnospiraceae bacterium]
MLILQLLLQFLSLTAWLFIIPFLTGLLPARFIPKERRTPGVIFLAGFIIFLAVFELISIIVVLNAVHGGMAILLRWFTPVAIALAALGLGTEIVVPSVLFTERKTSRGTLTFNNNFPPIWQRRASSPGFLKTITQIPEKIFGKNLSWETKLVWLLFFILLGFQLFMALTRASFDGDDAYYIVQSLIAKERGFLYRVEPYTGDSTVLNMRNALAVFPLWITMLAEKARIHPTIVAHSILPLFLLPMTYLLYFQIGKSLLKNKLESLPIFMVFISLIQIFGNVSIFTNETFLMTRTWQGKAFAAGFIIPAVLWLFLLISEFSSAAVYWFLLGILIWAAGISSSLAVFLVLILVTVFGFYLAIYHRSFRFLLKTAAACIPGAAYVILYLILI